MLILCRVLRRDFLVPRKIPGDPDMCTRSLWLDPLQRGKMERRGPTGCSGTHTEMNCCSIYSRQFCGSRSSDPTHPSDSSSPPLLSSRLGDLIVAVKVSPGVMGHRSRDFMVVLGKNGMGPLERYLQVRNVTSMNRIWKDR